MEKPAFIVREMPEVHCARGPKRCKKCESVENLSYWALLDLNPREEIESCRMTIQFEWNGNDVHSIFDVKQRFDSESDAETFASRNSFPIVRK